MDCDRIEGDIDSARGQANKTTLITLEEYQCKDVTSAEDQCNERTHQGTAGNITELALGGTLEERGRRHQGADKEKSQPT